MATRLTLSAWLAGHDGAVTAHALTGREALSQPYRYQLDFSADDVLLDEALGGDAEVVAEDQLGHVRFLHGVVDRVQLLASDEQRTSYRVTLVPRPFLLSYRFGSRIFQDLSIPEVVQKVFRNAGLEDPDFHWRLGKTYAKREILVQYNESEWDFACRLLEEEGIWFAWEHQESGTRMVLADDSTQARAQADGTLRFHHDADLHGEAVRVWDWRTQGLMAVARATVNDYDMLRPSRSLLCEEEVGDVVVREHYEHPGRFFDPAVGQRLAKTRLEELRAGRLRARASSNAMFLQVGQVITLEEHPHQSGEHLVCAIDVRLRVEEETTPGPLVDRGVQEQRVDLQTQPRAVAYRPPRVTPRPRLCGLQTAIVTGPAGQEIHCDVHGRVKLQFHWDREGRLDERSSLWIRVAQANTTGSIMIPRIGWEVLVEFQDGDPDRPICLGRVWNAFHPPPLELPAHKTVSGHMSNASPDNGGTNAVTFDDAAGSERLTIHGHHDIHIVAANNKQALVRKHATHAVAGNRSASVGGSETIAIKGSHSATVMANQHITVGAKRDVKVNGDAAIEITGTLTRTVGGLEDMRVGSPAQGVLQILKAMAITVATGVAATAAERAKAAMLGPLMPALEGARAALGQSARFAGPAAAMLSGGDPATAIFGTQLGALSDVAGAADAAEAAGGLSAAVASGLLDATQGGGAGVVGEGVWGTTVTGAVTEQIGALAAMSSAQGISIGIGGNSTETVGAARIELIKGGKAETIGLGKVESVAGAYVVDVKEGFSVDARAAVAFNIAGELEQKIGGGHAMSARSEAVVSASKVALEAATKITLKCGDAEISIDASGIAIKAKELTIEGTEELKLAPASITPGM